MAAFDPNHTCNTTGFEDVSSTLGIVMILKCRRILLDELSRDVNFLECISNNSLKVISTKSPMSREFQTHRRIINRDFRLTFNKNTPKLATYPPFPHPLHIRVPNQLIGEVEGAIIHLTVKLNPYKMASHYGRQSMELWKEHSLRVQHNCRDQWGWVLFGDS